MKKLLLAKALLIILIAICTAQSSGDTLTAQHDTAQAAQAQDPCIEATDSAALNVDAAFREPYHNHAPEDQIYKVTPKRKPAFVFILIVFQLGLLAYLRKSFPKSLEEMWRGLTNLTMAQQLYRDQELTMPVSAIFYNINFVLSAGIFLFLLNDHFGWKQIEQPSLSVSLLSFLWIVIVLYSLKYGTLKFTAMVFPFKHEVNQYNFNFFLAQKTAGVLLIPVNLLIAYAPDYLQSAIIVIALIMIAAFVIGTILKGLEISRNLLQHDAFHYFIYICTLEIAPVCILVKVVVEWLS